MLFNSMEFFIFLPIVLSLYFILPFRMQNVMLLGASYFFYGYWDWRFLGLILATTIMDFTCSKFLSKIDNEGHRKKILFLSIFFNLGILCFFKYFNFFFDSFQALLQGLSLNVSAPVLRIILPVGISFYTFQTMSYTIDVYHRKYKPVKNFIDFALYISFFPQLVAGPIERASHLIPQITKPRRINGDMVSSGIYLFITGMFKKVVIADNLSILVEQGFSDISSLNAITALITIYAFAWQIYCDFSGYSDIARGVAKFLGIDLMANFNLPYFSMNPAEFWKRWHISLSSWLRDYLYISLGGNRYGFFNTCKNLMITMVLGGLWHGASWNFVIWGVYQGALLIAHRILLKLFPNFKMSPVLSILIFFQFTCIGWVFFRAGNLTDAISFLQAFGNFKDISFYEIQSIIMANKMSVFLIPLIVAQFIQYFKKDIFVLFNYPIIIRPIAYLLIASLMMMFGKWEAESFLYFQF